MFTEPLNGDKQKKDISNILQRLMERKFSLDTKKRR